MQDRVPLYPGRVTLTPVAGQENTFDMVRADQPTQEGTPLNKATLLKDVTASILGLPNTAVPDDAFLALTIGVGAYGYRVKVQLSDGTPVEGATVSGIDALPGASLVSDKDGIILGKSANKTVTIECTSPYIDQKAPAKQAVTSTGTVTDITVTLIDDASVKKIMSSAEFRVSPRAKSVDATAVGGGGGGGGGTNRYRTGYGGAGGGGGYVSTSLAIPVSFSSIKITIAAGGEKGVPGDDNQPGVNGKQGGTTKIVLGKTSVSANGGTGGEGAKIDPPNIAQGGDGNGKGGRGAWHGSDAQYIATAGEDGTKYIFNERSLGLAGGGGGGGGAHEDDSKPPRAGGRLGGATGAAYGNSFSDAGEAKLGGGGGGGTGIRYMASNGGPGIVYLRFRFNIA